MYFKVGYHYSWIVDERKLSDLFVMTHLVVCDLNIDGAHQHFPGGSLKQAHDFIPDLRHHLGDP